MRSTYVGRTFTLLLCVVRQIVASPPQAIPFLIWEKEQDVWREGGVSWLSSHGIDPFVKTPLVLVTFKRMSC
ncbi:hypothetical protein IE53DRAFT_389432 [Violaceomyces palustris]|uniref:Uncharacterized protein n=1 Tax=Violaceomyces palustris TaxID=1673888 RepID=A0ACD0NRH3_9BASI|nr:hypothetical protein IE53DRAFT_389432 [Violaceomyces palustris]